MACASATIMAFRLSFVVSLFAFSCGNTGINGDCKFPALFAFGDSNTDTGASYAVFRNIWWPNGISVGRVFKRFCDGRLIIDFLVATFIAISGITPTISADDKFADRCEEGWGDFCSTEIFQGIILGWFVDKGCCSALKKMGKACQDASVNRWIATPRDPPINETAVLERGEMVWKMCNEVGVAEGPKPVCPDC